MKPLDALFAAIFILACVAVTAFAGLLPGCGGGSVNLAPAAQTFDAIAQCVIAFDSVSDPHEALEDTARCAPVALRALQAWCTAEVIHGPVCDALSQL